MTLEHCIFINCSYVSAMISLSKLLSCAKECIAPFTVNITESKIYRLDKLLITVVASRCTLLVWKSVTAVERIRDGSIAELASERTLAHHC